MPAKFIDEPPQIRIGDGLVEFIYTNKPTVYTSLKNFRIMVWRAHQALAEFDGQRGKVYEFKNGDHQAAS